MSARWHDAVAPARQAVACGTEEHEVAWRRGRLVLTDHHSLEGERALAALGAKAPGCLTFTQHWFDGLRKPDFLEEWAKLSRTESSRQQWYQHELTDWVWSHGRVLTPLAYLSDGMLDRLAYATLHRLLTASGGPDDSRRELIRQATVARARRAVVKSLELSGVPGGVAALVRFGCQLADTRPAAAGMVDSPASSWMSLRLRPSWLVDVFARDLAVIGGRFVLDAAPDGTRSGRYRVLTASWSGDGPLDVGLSTSVAGYDPAAKRWQLDCAHRRERTR